MYVSTFLGSFGLSVSVSAWIWKEILIMHAYRKINFGEVSVLKTTLLSTIVL